MILFSVLTCEEREVIPAGTIDGDMLADYAGDIICPVISPVAIGSAILAVSSIAATLAVQSTVTTAFAPVFASTGLLGMGMLDVS